jgi:hypothetical protein
MKSILYPTHCYKGWKISRPAACTIGFAYVLNLAALDIGIELYNARRRGNKHLLGEDDEE